MQGTGPLPTRRQLAIALLGGIAVALVAAAVASGGGGPFVYTDASTTITNNGQNFARAGCGGGPVTGGGVFLSGSDLGAEVNSSSPHDDNDANRRPDDGWEGWGINDGSDKTYAMTVEVICAQAMQPIYRDKLFEFARNSHHTGRRSCPSGTIVAGGGASVAGTGLDDELVASFPYDDDDRGAQPDDGWAATANSGDDRGFITVYAICSTTGGLRYVERSKVGAADDQFNVKARCREDERVAGGGAKVSKPGQDAEIASLHPFDDDDPESLPDDGFQGWANNQGPGERRLTTFAICR